MKISYIILAHKYPEQLRRLVQTLQEDWVDFYVHIDKRSDLKSFKREISDIHNVYFLHEKQRHEGTWGDIGIVKATLDAISMVLKNNKNGYCVLMSGQDYPLRSNKSIYNFFEKNKGTNYISIVQTPGNWDYHYLDRISKYKINKSSKRGHFLMLPSIFEKEFYTFESLGKLNFLRKSGKFKEIFTVLKKRKFPSYIKPYGGGVYFALPISTLQKIQEFHHKQPGFLEFNTYTLCADEIFFQSIIAYLQTKDPFEIRRSLTYVNWERPSGPLPVTFKEEDFAELKIASQNHLFARKFDSKIDEKILDRIDGTLLN